MSGGFGSPVVSDVSGSPGRSGGSCVGLLSLKKSKSWKKSDKVGKVGFDFLLDFWQKKYFINGDVLNAE